MMFADSRTAKVVCGCLGLLSTALLNLSDFIPLWLAPIVALISAEIFFILTRVLMTGTINPWDYGLRLFEYDATFGFNLKANWTEGNKAGLLRRFWRSRTGNDSWPPITLSTNEMRYRGRVSSAVKKKGVFRILAVGDSTVFGAFNQQTGTWPFQLEKLLNQRCSGEITFEVMNLGIGSMRFAGVIGRYFRDYSNFDVDLILLSNNYNDFKDRIGGRWHDSEFNSYVADQINHSTRRLLRRLARASLSKQAINKIKDAYLCFYRILRSSKEKKQSEHNISPRQRASDQLGSVYNVDEQWLTAYSEQLKRLASGVRREHPDCIIRVVSPISFLTCPEETDSTNDSPLDVESLFDLTRAAKIELPGGTPERHAQYLVHCLRFRDFLKKQTADLQNCSILDCSSFSSLLPLEVRRDIFWDQFHLIDEGNKFFAQYLVNQLKQDSTLRQIFGS